MSAQTNRPEWASALDTLLGLYWALEQQALDQVTREQLAPGQEPENVTFQPTPDSYGPVFRLNYLYGKYCGSGAGGYLVVVDPGEFTVCARDMTPQRERAALHAALDWLKPPYSSYYPESATRQQQQELDERRGRLRRIAQDRMNEVDGNKPVQYVTLLQMAAIVSKTKRTLERTKSHKVDPLPPPAIEGGGGKSDEWLWDEVRPWLERKYRRQLPLRYPTLNASLS